MFLFTFLVWYKVHLKQSENPQILGVDGFPTVSFTSSLFYFNFFHANTFPGEKYVLVLWSLI